MAQIPQNIFGILSTLVAVTLAVPAFADEPAIGDIFELKWDTSFKGWTNFSSSRSDVGQDYTVFRNGNSFIIAGTEVIRDNNGTTSIVRIKFIRKFILPAGQRAEDGNDCGFLQITPAMSFFDPKSHIATGFFAAQGDILVRRWFVDDPDLCAYGGD
jgi:hypothetical protein